MIKTVCLCGPEVLRSNHVAAVGRGLPWLAACPQRDRPLAIVAGGYSARDYIDEILAFPGDVMAINGAYDWLQSHGRVADWVMLLDPKDNYDDLLRRPHVKTTFLVASMCGPKLFDALEGQNVLLYRAPQDDLEFAPPNVPGGSTTLCRAPVAGAILGYREMVLYGADSCFLGPTTHVYGSSSAVCSSEIPRDAFKVRVSREWLTTLPLLAQAEYLAEMIPAMHPLKVEMRGDHLAADLLAHGSWQVAQAIGAYVPPGAGHAHVEEAVRAATPQSWR